MHIFFWAFSPNEKNISKTSHTSFDNGFKFYIFYRYDKTLQNDLYLFLNIR